MGDLRSIAFIVIFAFMVGGFFLHAMFMASTDANKVEPGLYLTVDNQTSSIMQNVNYTYNNTGSPASNLQLASQDIAQTISTSQQSLQGASSTEALLIAFGTVSKLGLQIAGLLFWVLIDAGNFAYGVLTIFDYLPAPWNGIGIAITGTIIAGITVYIVFAIVSMIQKWRV